MKHFFKIKNYTNTQKWQSIVDEDNSKEFEIEMTKTLINVNNFITKIEIESSILNKIVELKNEDEKKLKEYLAMGRELLTKLKVLASLEKSSVMEKYEQSHVRKLSYATTDDTASGVDTESVIDGYGAFSRDQSFDRKDSKMITLAHKYAATFMKQYEMFDKLNHDVEEIIDRFNGILDFIHQQLQQRSMNIITNTQQITKEDKSDSYSDSRVQSEENEMFKDNAQISTESESDLKSVIDILTNYLQKSSLIAVYKIINTSGTGHLLEHTYSCNVSGLYSEGKSRKKIKAKEEAAAQMIKCIIKRQICNNLPQQICPLSESQIHELSILLTEREDLIDKLEEICLQSHEPPPLYTVLSETAKSNEPYFAIKCEAMGYTTVGHGNTKLQAKKNAAKSIFSLVTKRKKSHISFQ